MNVSVWVDPPGGVNSIVTLKDSGTKTSVLPTTWAGEKFPIPVTTNRTVCPSQVPGNTKLLGALIGSAAAPWARAVIARIPKVTATQSRRSIQPRPLLQMTSDGVELE
jgi:hypothetical protein